MALNPSSNPTMAGRITAADADYPYGSSKNESAPGAGDGTPYFKARADDLFGLQQAILRAANLAPNGAADTAIASQYLQGLIELAMGRAQNFDETGVAGAYQLDERANQQLPASLFDGLTALFVAGSPNPAAACTAQLGALGALSIKLRGGLTDPPIGAIRSDVVNRLVYRAAPAPHWEIDRSGAVGTQIFTVGGTYTPSPGLKQALVLVVSGGGGGARGSAGQRGAGGAGGGYAERLLTPAQIGASQTVTIGVGGTGATVDGTSGVNGGNTTFGALVTASGAGGGSGAGAGGSPGLGTTGDLITGGQYGSDAPSGAGGGGSGDGGASRYGGGGRSSSSTGTNGTGHGGGGGGGNGGAGNGGAGKDGIVIVWEFF